MNTPNIILENTTIRIEPLNLHHTQDLFAAAQDPLIWQYLPTPMPNTLDDMQAIVEQAIAYGADGQSIPFAIIYKKSEKAVGSTRYWEFFPHHKALEIGWTWLGVNAQRTGVNTTCKYLLLQHAFETLNFQRVQLKTDRRNIISQNAIERLGATKEGIRRQNIICWDGSTRDTVYYSILQDEWPCIKRRLENFQGKIYV